MIKSINQACILIKKKASDRHPIYYIYRSNQKLFRLFDVETPRYIIYKNNIDNTIGSEASPIGAPVLLAFDHSPSPGKNGSSHVLLPDLVNNPRAGEANAEFSVSLAIDLFSHCRYELDGNSLVLVATGVSSADRIDSKGMVIQKNNTRNKSICSFVFIQLLFFAYLRVCSL